MLQCWDAEHGVDTLANEISLAVSIQPIVKVLQQLAVEQEELGDLRMQEPPDLGLDRRLLHDRRTNPQIGCHPRYASVEGGASN